MFDAPDFDQHESVTFFKDTTSGLRAIVAIHSTALGAALGGCRVRPYETVDDAIADALRLSRAMSFKNALGDRPFGGANAIIIGNSTKDKTSTLLAAFGRRVDMLGGTTKVSMSMIPPERSGMASGIGGTLRFVGLVMGIAGLGAVLTNETKRHFDHAASAAGLADVGGGREFMVSRIIAGDIASVVTRVSFALGFSTVLLVAAALATIAGLLTFILVSTAKTAPSHMRQPDRTELPEALD